MLVSTTTLYIFNTYTFLVGNNLHGDKIKEAEQVELTYESLPSMVKILDTSKCIIGLKNPAYRNSDESFCRESLSRSLKAARLYPLNTVVDYFIFGISKFL